MTLSRRRMLAASAAAFTAAPMLARAQTPAGVAESFVAAVDGDAAAREAWISTWMSPAGLKRAGREQLLATFEGVQRASGGLDLVSEAPGQRGPMITVRARRGGQQRTFDLRMDRADRTKVAGLPSLPMPTPYDQPLLAAPVGREALKSAIARRVAFNADRDEFSGVVRVVDPSGAVLLETSHGQADRAAGAANGPDWRYHLGSADKSFTAILIGRLIEQGRLSFDTRLAEVVPDYANKAAAEKITVRHLLTHSAGLGDLFSRPDYQRDKPIARVSELLPCFWAAEPDFEPGTKGDYANEGFVVLGAIVERVTGRPWWDELADHVYAPAGMAHSAHFIKGQPAARRAIGYRYADGDVLGLGPRRDNEAFLGYRGNSCGGGYSTVGDMTGYLRALRAGRLLSPAMTETMTRQNVGGLGQYGMGFQNIPMNGRTLRGHGGGGPFSGVNGFSGVIWETGWAVSVLGNYDAPFAQLMGEDIGRMLAAQDA
jgi:CubicO group peptidase (beta-lactamase class C family)